MTTFQPITIGSDLLLSWYDSRANVSATRASAAQNTSNESRSGPRDTIDVTPPWDSESDQPSTEELTRSALADGQFLDPSRFSDEDAPDDVKNLFAIHDAIETLWGIAGEAEDPSLSDARRRSLDRQFQEGLKQIDDFLNRQRFDDVSITMGEAREKAVSEVPITRAEPDYTTDVLHTGAYEDPVSSFQNATPFTITSTNLSGVETDVLIDLDQMPAGQTRNMENVTAFINQELEAAGLTTRFDDVRLDDTTDEDSTPQYGFTIEGTASEALSFSTAPADSGPAVFVVGSSGALTNPVQTDDEDRPAPTVRAGQITKFTDLDAPGGPTVGSSIRLEARGAADSEATSEEDGSTPVADAIITQTAAADDGFYALAEVEGSLNGVGPQGERDVVLLKYDTSGRQVWSRALGATESAEGLALDVGADGTVAVAGSLTGALGTTIDVGEKDAFVSTYSADGDLNWTKRFGSRGDDAVQAVTVADDGRVFVGGTTSGSLTGAPQEGEQDGFVRAFDAAGATSWTVQGASVGADTVSALTMDGDNVVFGGSGEGQGLVGRIDTATGTVDTGWGWSDTDFEFASIADVAVDSDTGDIFIAGGARSNFDAPANANSGARDAYVMSLDGADASVNYGVYVGGAGEDVAADLTVANGKVYLAGRTDSDLETGAGLDGDRQSFVTQIDAGTGAVEWSQQIEGRGGQSAASGLVVSPTADNTLSGFGLPTGDLQLTDSRAVADRTTAKAGDYFDIRVNGQRTRITLDEGESMRSLAFQIDLALGADGDATTRRVNGGDGLSIEPREGVEVELVAGREGQDLLTALGIEPGLISKPDPDEETTSASASLRLSSDISIATRSDAQSAIDVLDDAMSELRSAYRDMTNPPAEKEDKPGKNANGPAPEFLTERIANYEAALARLGG